MSIQNVFKSLFSTATRRRPIRRSRQSSGFRPQFEALEDRCLLAAFVVNSVLDVSNPLDGMTTLREAIEAANSSAGADQITFDDAVFNAVSADTITLAQGQLPTVTDQLAIDGSIDGGAARVSLDGGGVSRILYKEAAQLDLSNLILKNGRASLGTPDDYGGAIFNLAGALNLVNTDVIGCSGFNRGGGLYSANGDVTVTGGTFSGNFAYNGGAIFIDQGSLMLTGAMIQNNEGGFDGGGVFNFHGTMTIDNTTIRANRVTGGTGGRGGAILNYNNLTIRNSTIADNTAMVAGGGVWHSNGTLTIINTTITGNTAPSGGGVFVSLVVSPVTITSSTISDNTSGDAGIYLDWGTLTLRSTIVANSKDSAGAAQKDLARAASSTKINAERSLIESVDNATINGTKKFNLIGVDPKLGPLADNGGPTLTHALLAGSPAINKGYNPLSLPYDQRGPGFPRVLWSVADIGAYESNFTSPPDISISDVQKKEGNSGQTAFVFTVSLSSASSETVTVNYATADGTATAGTDYQATSGTLTFASGETSMTITVLVNADTIKESNEAFFINLSGATNATILDAQAVATILNDDNRK